MAVIGLALRANIEHIGEWRPGAGLGSQVEVLTAFERVGRSPYNLLS